MPTYEYICDACGTEFEKFQSITAPPVKVCPKCGKRKVRKLISAGAGLIFKGSGFYITDYRDGGYNEKAKADKAGGESKPAETKTGDAKPAETKASDSKETKPAAATTEAAKPAAKAEAPAKPQAARKDSSKSKKR